MTDDHKFYIEVTNKVPYSSDPDGGIEDTAAVYRPTTIKADTVEKVMAVHFYLRVHHEST